MRIKRSSKKSLTDQAAELVEQVTPHVEAARERIVNDYLPVAQSVLADAREVAREVAQDAREAAQEAAANAEKSTRKSRKKAAKKARAKAGQMATAAGSAVPAAAPLTDRIVEKVEPKRSRKKRFLLLLGILGAGAAVVKKLRSEAPAATPYTPPPRPRPVPDQPSSTTSTSTSTSTAPPAPPAQHFEPDPDAPAETTDQGGAFLDEVIADADEHPGKVTTPDRPAEVEDVSTGKSHRKD